MNTRLLDVFINDLRVGRLREQNDLWAFDYDPAWTEAAGTFDLSPALPRTVATHRDGASNRPVQWYFDNLLPEEALRGVLAKDAAIPETDAFGLLAYYGAESAGSLVLRDSQQPAMAQTGLRPLTDEALSDRIRNLPRLPLSHDAPKHMSLAGAQHKLPVVYREGRLYEPLPGDVSTHILKPDHPTGDYPASVSNEYFVMRLADRLGLPVPKVHRHYCPQPVYLIDRFDRTASGDGRTSRRHVIDACQLLNKARNFKYQAANVATLQEVIQCVRVRPQARLMLFRWLVFNVLVGNGDNHLKNISFLVSSEGIEIAPHYDLLSTAVYATAAMAGEKAAWLRVEMALPPQGARYFGDITQAMLLESGAGLGLSQATVTRELNGMVRKIKPQAQALYDAIETENSYLPQGAKAFFAGELRLLRSIIHIVITEMVARVSIRA